MSAMATTPLFPSPKSKTHTDGDFFREEVRLANRNHGILLETLRHDVTPAGMHYLLTHFDVPYVPEPEAWTLGFGGLVQTPFALSLADIRALPQRTLRVTLECAGNGRSLATPRWPSMPWGECAVGTAEWTGTPLKPLLERAGLKAEARDIVFTGADRGFDGIEHDYARSLTPDLALSGQMADDILLVTAMNGQPLLPQHGAPLRMVVPGWYGMASVKWLTRIEAVDYLFPGQQQIGTYVYKQTKDDPGTPVTAIRVKSLMVPPGMPDWYTRRRAVEAGAVTVHGRAWSGNGVPIRRVEFACDGVWQDATLDVPAVSPYAWRGWRCIWDATAGEHKLQCRATDANGCVQPVEQRWDRHGFGNNMVHRVPVLVR
jgi:DMSO/TMAO reductase YedYZ molybdopterin-dependent catalytic subunit